MNNDIDIQAAKDSLIMVGKAMGCKIRKPSDYQEAERCIALKTATANGIVLEKGETYCIERDMRAYDAAIFLRMGLIVMLPNTAFDQVRMSRSTFDTLLALANIKKHTLSVGE